MGKHQEKKGTCISNSGQDNVELLIMMEVRLANAGIDDYG